jgi:hypothetical protein
MTKRRASGTLKTTACQRVSVARAAESGDSLAALTALRDRLAHQLDETRSARDVASLSRQLSAVLAQIENTPKREPSLRNEIAAKRARRQAERLPVRLSKVVRNDRGRPGNNLSTGIILTQSLS